MHRLFTAVVAVGLLLGLSTIADARCVGGSCAVVQPVRAVATVAAKVRARIGDGINRRQERRQCRRARRQARRG